MQVLHRDEELAIGLADVVDLHDVLVMQACGDPGFVEKHSDEALVLGVLRPDSLQYDVPLETLDAIGAPQEDVRHPS